MLPLFSPIGTTHPKFRGARYHAVLADLRENARRDGIEKSKTKPERKRARSNRIKQQGAM
jgi:hypothetical protein